MNKSEYAKSLKILNLPSSAKLSAIKKSYRKLVKIYHPDKYQDLIKKEIAQEKFKKINDAYHYLIDNYDENFAKDLKNDFQKNNEHFEQKAESFDFGDDVILNVYGGNYRYYQQNQSSSCGDFFTYCKIEKQRIMPLWTKIIIYLLFNSLAFVIYYLFS